MKKYFLCVVLNSFSLVAAEWYEGGNLHRSTLKEWVAATPQNRLATAADFATKTTPKPQSMAELRERAVAIEACVSAVAAPTPRDKQRKILQMETADIAAGCVIQLQKN